MCSGGKQRYLYLFLLHTFVNMNYILIASICHYELQLSIQLTRTYVAKSVRTASTVLFASSGLHTST